MWSDLRARLARLAAVDSGCAVFGASRHRYRLGPLCAPSDLERVEARVGTSIPDALRQFYLEVGDGGAGPSYGVASLAELSREEELLAIVEVGCGSRVCIATDGRLVSLYDDGEAEELGLGMVGFYERWLDTELHLFSILTELMDGPTRLEGIASEMRAHGVLDVAARIASVARYHGPPPDRILASYRSVRAQGVRTG